MSGVAPVLLVVDDEPGILRLIERFATKVGFDVATAGSGREALQTLQSAKAAVALVDLRMPDVDGLEVLRRIRAADPDCQVILMTGHASIDTAIEAIKHGAMDYLSKPLDFDRLEVLLTRVHDEIERRGALLAAESHMVKQLEFCGMVGRSPVMLELFEQIRRFAPHVRTALVTGETGTGKELVARALHKAGPRAHKKFVTINCSAVVDSLFESELFGHMRGAFTGAVESKPGLFEAADGGTLFLDEIGELPLQSQAKLLRVIETGEVQRVGGLDTKRVDVRVLAATNRDLRAESAGGRFREDLFYRLSVVELCVTPLRERREDIPYLTSAFVKHFATQFNKPILGPTPAAERVLLTAPWPGNVRELRNAIERICILTDDRFFTEKETIAGLGTQAMPEKPAAPAPAGQQGSPLLLADAERDHISRVLQETRGNKKAAAALLGLSRRALYRKLDRLGLR
ncbi:MAG TPA: sigma-54 dependent transcriptional regulator [Vicinamibacterales bacterium]|nr:sigma-54 dependent transcriptional regulator [Vicinamibacterales bacterium]